MPLTQQEERTLITRSQAGDAAARERMLTANRGLVFAKVLRMLGPNHPLFADMVQEGQFGLMLALEKFDPNRGIKFSTYAYPAITTALRRGMERHCGPVRVNATQRNLIMCLLVQTAERLRGQLEREPTETEVIEALPRRKRRGALLVWRAGAAPGNISPQIESPRAEAGFSPEVLARVRALVDTLPERAQFVIRRRFGMDGEPQTRARVGRSLGLSRERVRQIELDGLRRLKSGMR